MAFAAAMAWVEASVVAYLRVLIERIEPYQPDPLPLVGGLGGVELVREAATLVMLFLIGALAGRTWRSRLGLAVAAFGAWDLLYYVFLKVITGWPHSLLDWDVLFLIPLPWWGPVWAPAAIAALMLAGGTLLARDHSQVASPLPGRAAWVLAAAGAALALYCFMADALRALGGGTLDVRRALPVEFPWPLFLLALALLSAPVVCAITRLGGRGRSIERHYPARTASSPR